MIEMEGVRKGDVLDIAEPDWNFFYEDAILVAGGAEFVGLVFLEEQASDKVRTVLPELEDILLSFVDILVIAEFLMLFDVQAGLPAVPPCGVAGRFLNQQPLVFVEVLLIRLISH